MEPTEYSSWLFCHDLLNKVLELATLRCINSR
jgi:hypothetical protein